MIICFIVAYVLIGVLSIQPMAIYDWCNVSDMLKNRLAKDVCEECFDAEMESANGRTNNEY